MQEIKAVFQGSVPRTKDVCSFCFKPEAPFQFIPGQFAQVIFDEKDRQNKELNKYLSFSCDTGKAYFEVTKKLSQSAFSARLKSLSSGDKILFKLPMGNCVLDANDHEVVFIVGGIGITPVISILEHIMNHNLPISVKLIYSNWTEQDIAFKAELDHWSEQNSNIQIIHTVVSEPPKDPKIKFGLIDKNFLSEYQSDLIAKSVYIFGPPGMVKAMKTLCQEIGVDTSKIKAESFLGYSS